MGSWNHTCALTNLPVFSGEPVYVVMLLEGARYDQYKGHHCYPNCYYHPLPIFFEGDYNDYGGVENCKGDYLHFLLEKIKDKLIEFDLGENQYHDIPVKKDNFDVTQLFEADHESRLYTETRDFDKEDDVMQKRLSHIVIRKNVLDSLLKKYKISYASAQTKYKTIYLNFEEAVKMQMDSFCSSNLKERIMDIKRMIDSRKSLGKNADDSSEIFLAGLCSHSNDILYWVSEGYYLNQNIINVGELLYDNSDTPEKLEKVTRHLMVMVFLQQLYSNGRRMWIKPSGCGSQNDDTTAQKMISQLTNIGIRDINAIKKTWKEDY